MYLVLSTEEFIAGSEVSGRVVLTLGASMEVNGSLMLGAGGQECAEISKNKISKTDVWKIVLELRKFEGTLAAGEYTFPFSVNLPPSLPSSVEYSSNDGDEEKGCRIRYILSTGIDGYLCVDKPIIVHSAPLPSKPVPCMLKPESHKKLMASGIASSGLLAIGARVENTNVLKGGHAHLNLACYNKSSVEIQKVNIEVVERFQYIPAGKRQLTKETRKVLFELEDVNVPSLDKHSKSRSELRGSMNEKKYIKAMYSQLVSEKKSGVRIDIPPSCHETYKGKLLNVSHFLDVKFKTSARHANPHVAIPIRVGRAFESDASTSPTPVVKAIMPNTPGAGCPIVDAVAVSVPIGDNITDVPIVTPVSFTLGGTFVEQDIVTVEAEPFTGRRSLFEVEPLPPPPSTLSVSLDSLLLEMAQSANDYDILMYKLQDPSWNEILSTLSTSDFASVMLRVSNEFDQPRVAVLLATHMQAFTCEHAASAVRSCADYNRAAMVQQLLPHCRDVGTNAHVLRRELSDWDQTVTEHDFQLVMESSSTS